MNYPAGVRTAFQQNIIDSRSVFCTGCAHSEFLHREHDMRLCLFSECGCTGWRQPREHDEMTAEIASES